MEPAPSAPLPVRRAARIRGVVQGVGFRPAVFRLASSLGLSGFVRNDAEGVWLEVEGPAAQVDRFFTELRDHAPPLAQIASVDEQACALRNDEGFRILESDGTGSPRAQVPVDTAPCDDCLRELFDPRDRRYRYPFINCTACGPRYTIVRALPYDRARTTMEAFALCEECRSEYADPADRRFHAEPTACPRCGPRLRLSADDAPALEGDAALVAAARLVAAGRIVAVKGVGGFLLACDARNEDAVVRLRERKHRPHKPFAVMARDLDTVRAIADLDDAAVGALRSPARPIVLLRLRDDASLASTIAPGLREIGVCLPSTPLHHLLLAEGPALQVMTSGNRASDPIAIDDEDAREALAGIADAFLLHDRAIHTRADDSVVRIVCGEPRAVRRARGFAPEPLTLPFEPPPLLAVGGEQKNTVCLTRGREAYLSQHLGDLGSLRTFAAFEETIRRLGALLDVEPRLVAHDLHPDYDSTRWAVRSGLECVAVQHHHAHVASCLAEHGVTERVLGVAFDGTGCGPDGALWGGEFLEADLRSFRRLGHLRALPLPGGEAAIREPWRLAVAALADAGEQLDLLSRIDSRKLHAVQQLTERNVAAPRSTGAGRWFDAVAALCRVRDVISYEAQAAMELEALCAEPDGRYDFRLDVRDDEPVQLDLRPTIRALARELRHGVPTPLVAARFHETLAAGLVAVCRLLRSRGAPRTVALSGGCFQNKRFTERTRVLLAHAGFQVLMHARVPPNDGGLALGQAAVAGFCCAERGS